MTGVGRLRAVMARGVVGETPDFVGLPPVGYERYTVTGTMRETVTGGPVLETVTVRDKETGACVTLRGATAALDDVPAKASEEYLAGLWAAARHIASHQARLGRPHGADVTLSQVEQARLRLIEKGIRPSRTALATETPCAPESVLRAVKRHGYENVAQWVHARESSTF